MVSIKLNRVREKNHEVAQGPGKMDFLYGNRSVLQDAIVGKVLLKTFVDYRRPPCCAAGTGMVRCSWVKVLHG